MGILEIYNDTKFYPAAVALEVTLRCNMRCLHCGSSADGKTRENELSLAEWCRVVDELKEMNTEFVTLSGGEPFVWPHWRALASHIAKSGMALSIISNGYNITQEDVKFLKENKMWNIALSVDGTQKTHNHIRQIKDSFERVMRAIDYFKKAGIKVGVATSVNKLNLGELPEIRKVLNDAGINLWQVQVVNHFGRGGDNKDSLGISRDQYKELVEFISSSQKKEREGKITIKTMPADSIGYCHSCAIDVWNDMEWSGCNAGKFVLGIQSHGDVTGCLSLQHKDFIAGNVREKSIKEIWNDDKAFGYTRGFSADKLCGHCKDCNKGEECKSGCVAMGYSLMGELYNNPYCYKSIVEQNL